jgi:2-keto-3-deoxy-L-rhamnonate aldolase RhmA
LEEYARPSLIKLFQHAGFDFVYVEYEHTYFSPDDMADAILSARDNGLPVIAKTPQLERQEVAKLLEAGVVGIQLPRTETREQVETLLSYLKFPPKGTRAVAPGWGNSDYRGVTDWQGWMDEQDEETFMVVHIETALAYENAEEILSVPGIDLCYAGPGDSSIELGHPGDYDHPDVRGPMEHVLKLCKKYGIAFGTTPSSGKAAGEWVQKGATFFEADSEIGFIRTGAAALLADYKKHIG